jgi:hypothetical protein
MGIRGIALKRSTDATAQGYGLTANNKLLSFYYQSKYCN